MVQKIDPEQSYLFGSHARGEARPDSDDELGMETGQAGGERWRFATDRTFGPHSVSARKLASA
jgi:hypothetical protein